MDEVELHLPPDVQYVGLARLVVTAAARQSGMDGARVEDLRIAVSEATANAIRAHQAAGNTQPVVLCCGRTGAEFRVTIADTGPGFEPVLPEVYPQRDWRHESGLGVTLIRGLSDRVDFVKGEGMTVNMQFSVGLG